MKDLSKLKLFTETARNAESFAKVAEKAGIAPLLVDGYPIPVSDGSSVLFGFEAGNGAKLFVEIRESDAGFFESFPGGSLSQTVGSEPLAFPDLPKRLRLAMTIMVSTTVVPKR